MPEGHLYRSMLLDFYGELLTPRQRECCELHYNEDLSLSEIAEQCGISRQGAWDNIRRASEAMEEIEEKTGLIRRSMETDARLRRVLALLERSLTGEGKARAGGEGEPHREAVNAVREAMEEVRSLLKEED